MRQTRKYKAALRCLNLNQLKAHTASHEVLYDDLDREGYTWDSGLGEWRPKRKDEYPENAPDGVPGVVRIRINANMSEITDVYQLITQAVEKAGGRIVQASDYYPNTRKGTGVRQYLEVYLQAVRS